jgi:hypothetical protein
MMHLNRIQPQLPPQFYRTYQLASPLTTHFRKATCAEVGCEHYRIGWQVRIEGLRPELLKAAKTSGRSYREEHRAEGETYLVFEAGQACFRAGEHRIRTDRPPLYIVRDGDHRGNPRGTKARLHQRPEHWQEDFAGHQQKIADAIQEG